MKLALSLANCFWLILPLLGWNILLAPRLTQEAITSDAHSPTWLLGTENILRLATFILPLLFPLSIDVPLGKVGLAVYLAGTGVYFASWIPLIVAPASAWSRSLPGLFAPRLTPWVALLGIALVAHSWLYGVLATIFIFFHTWHGIQNVG